MSPTPVPAAGERAVLEALGRISAAFVSSGRPEQLLDRVVDAALALVGGADGSVMLLSPDGGELQVVAAAGPDAGRKLGARQAASGSVAGVVLGRGEPLVLRGRAEAGPVASAHPRDIASALVLPLRVGERALGVLSVNRGPGAGAPAQDGRALELLTLLANQAAILVELGRLVEELRRKEERLELFVDRLLRAHEGQRGRAPGGGDARRALDEMLARAVREYAAGPRLEAEAPAAGQLTAREREVLRRLAEGLTNREIGERLYLSPDTVKDHVGEILRKLGAADRTQAAVIALRAGLVE